MPKVLMEISMSADACVVGPDVSPESPMGRGGERLHDWMFAGKSTAELEEVDGLDDDYFAAVVNAFLATGQGAQGTIDAAPSVLVDAAAITGFAVRWLETRAGSPVAPRPRGGSPSPYCCFLTQQGWWP